jgi:hypothetical protein
MPSARPKSRVFGGEDVFSALERHRGAGLQRLVSLATQRERHLALAIELKSAIVELPLKQHVAKHRTQLFVA